MRGVSIVLLVAMMFSPVVSAAVTDQQGQELAQICDITDYVKILSLTGGMPPASALLILDLTSLSATNEGGKAYFYTSPSSSLIDAVKQQCLLARANRDFTSVQAVLPQPTDSPARWIATAGQTVWIFALTPVADKQIKVKETKRRTQIASDLADLAKLMKKAGFLAATVDMVGFPYTLKETRADLAISVADKDGGNEQAVFAIKSGPTEHLSLSANLPVNSGKQVKLDDNNNVVAKDAPKEFLVGINYAWGDLFAPQPRISLNRAMLMAMARFSKTPLDTLGLAVGYNFGYAHVFAGPIWIRQPRDTASGATGSSAASGAAVDMKYKMNWRLGVAFDLKTAMDWVKQ